MYGLFDLQRVLYDSTSAALLKLPDANLWESIVLLGTAFVFGVAHAILPGHGKVVLTAYFAGRGSWRNAFISSVIVILTHVGSAIVFVLAGFAVVQRTIGAAGRSNVLETASGVLISLVGCWLLWQAIHPARRSHGSASTLAFVTGLVPCPLTTFVMSYAVAKGMTAIGVMLSIAFAAGMIATVAVLPVIASLTRESWLMRWVDNPSFGIGLRVFQGATALLIVGLGALNLPPSLFVNPA